MRTKKHHGDGDEIATDPQRGGVQLVIDAFVGLRASLAARLRGQPAALQVVCAWCPDAHAREYQRQMLTFFESDKVITHGMCPACVARMTAEADEYFAVGAK